jgi:hypothetical protein
MLALLFLGVALAQILPYHVNAGCSPLYTTETVIDSSVYRIEWAGANYQDVFVITCVLLTFSLFLTFSIIQANSHALPQREPR